MKRKQVETPASDFLPDMDAEMFLVDDLLGLDSDELETDEMPAGRALSLSPRRKLERLHQRQELSSILPQCPQPGESIHIVGNGLYDFWCFVPKMLDWIGRTENLYCSTWTLCRTNAVELFQEYDAGRIGHIHFTTGVYFKRRETSVYAMLLQGIRKRGGQYKAFENHAKVLLLDNAEKNCFLTCEGSANLTANPRVEQYVLTNDRALWEFHKGWMDEMLNKNE